MEAHGESFPRGRMAHAKDSGAEGGAFPRAQQDRLFSTRPASAKPAKGGRDRSAGPKGKDGEGKARGRSTGTGEQRKGKEGGERRGSSRPSALVASASASGGIPTIRFADELSFKVSGSVTRRLLQRGKQLRHETGWRLVLHWGDGRATLRPRQLAAAHLSHAYPNLSSHISPLFPRSTSSFSYLPRLCSAPSLARS